MQNVGRTLLTSSQTPNFEKTKWNLHSHMYFWNCISDQGLSFNCAFIRTRLALVFLIPVMVSDLKCAQCPGGKSRVGRGRMVSRMGESRELCAVRYKTILLFSMIQIYSCSSTVVLHSVFLGTHNWCYVTWNTLWDRERLEHCNGTKGSLILLWFYWFHILLFPNRSQWFSLVHIDFQWFSKVLEELEIVVWRRNIKRRQSPSARVL